MPVIYSYYNWSTYQLLAWSVEPDYAFSYGQVNLVMFSVDGKDPDTFVSVVICCSSDSERHLGSQVGL
jgi:hypothetical protein